MPNTGPKVLPSTCKPDVPPGKWRSVGFHPFTLRSRHPTAALQCPSAAQHHLCSIPCAPGAGEEPWPCTAEQLCWPNVPTFQVLRVLCCHGAGPMQTPWLTWLTTQRMNILLTPLQCDPDAQLLCAGLESKQYIWGALDLFQNRWSPFPKETGTLKSL